MFVLGPHGSLLPAEATGELIETTVVKQDGQSGLRCTGGFDTTLGALYITHLQPGGAAEAASPLPVQRGDRILALNGISLIDRSLKECLEMIRYAPEQFTLTLQVDGLAPPCACGSSLPDEWPCAVSQQGRLAAGVMAWPSGPCTAEEKPAPAHLLWLCPVAPRRCSADPAVDPATREQFSCLPSTSRRRGGKRQHEWVAGGRQSG